MILKLRPIQTKVIARVKQAIAEGKTDIFISAPTGVGKSFIGFELTRELKELEDFDSYILTSEKTLQAQYEADAIKYDTYNDAKSICGIDTYKCNINGEKFSLGLCKMMGKSNQEALKMDCSSTCEYLQRWVAAKNSPRTITSYSYFLLQMNYVLRLMDAYAPFQKRHLVICDEAHKLPDIIEGHFACSIDLKFVERIRSLMTLLRSTGNFSHRITYEGVETALYDCLMLQKSADNSEHLIALKALMKEYEKLLDAANELKEHFAERHLSKSTNSEVIKKKLRNLPREVRSTFAFADSLKDRGCKLEDYITIIKESSIDNIIVDDSGEKERTYHNLDDSYLFKKHFAEFSEVRIYMSATLQPELLIKRFGIDPEKAAVLDVDSAWDVRRSPIVLCETANLTYKNQEHGLAVCIRKIDELLKKHKNERGIIHTTSNVIMNEVMENSRFKDRLYCYTGTEEKMDILNGFKDFPKDAVLIGPSIFTGVDFAGDLARFNIVIKVSFPNTMSALWAKRYEVANHLCIGETASILEQAAGRTTRSDDDWSITYILDSRAKDFIKFNKKYFSSAFLKRIVT